MRAIFDDTLQVGDIIQPTAGDVPAYLRDKYFIVRELSDAGGAVLSWPYMDADCTVLFVPRDARDTERDHLAHCQAVERKEKAANKAMGLVLKHR